MKKTLCEEGKVPNGFHVTVIVNVTLTVHEYYEKDDTGKNPPLDCTFGKLSTDRTHIGCNAW
jgi:hypothetical protein